MYKLREFSPSKIGISKSSHVLSNLSTSSSHRNRKVANKTPINNTSNVKKNTSKFKYEFPQTCFNKGLMKSPTAPLLSSPYTTPRMAKSGTAGPIQPPPTPLPNSHGSQRAATTPPPPVPLVTVKPPPLLQQQKAAQPPPQPAAPPSPPPAPSPIPHPNAPNPITCGKATPPPPTAPPGVCTPSIRPLKLTGLPPTPPVTPLPTPVPISIVPPNLTAAAAAGDAAVNTSSSTTSSSVKQTTSTTSDVAASKQPTKSTRLALTKKFLRIDQLVRPSTPQPHSSELNLKLLKIYDDVAPTTDQGAAAVTGAGYNQRANGRFGFADYGGGHHGSGHDGGSSSWRMFKLTMSCITIAVSSTFGALFFVLGRPPSDDDGTQLDDAAYANNNVLWQYYQRARNTLITYGKMISEPSRDKLLPDVLKPPYYQPPYTLIMEFTDVLVHPEWTYYNGWRFKKRPGLDQFLEALYMKYEMVVYTAETGMTVFPIIDALDKNNLISYKLVRDATNFVDGHHTKDLDKLNRQLDRVVVVDWNPKSMQQHSDNLFKIPRWDGSDDDRTLYDLASFLLTIADWEVEDVRTVLKHYSQYEAPLEQFKQRQIQLIAATTTTTSTKSGGGSAGGGPGGPGGPGGGPPSTSTSTTSITTTTTTTTTTSSAKTSAARNIA